MQFRNNFYYNKKKYENVYENIKLTITLDYSEDLNLMHLWEMSSNCV